MGKTQGNNLLNDLLNMLVNPIHRYRQQTRVPEENEYRILDEMFDETGIGNNNEPINHKIKDVHILDCGHTSQNNLGGRCHICGGLACNRCISMCSSCGHSICPQDTTIDNLDGQNRPYCRSCAEELKRSLKLRAIGNMFFSTFISDDNAQKKE